MKFEDFQLIHDTTIDTSITKRDQTQIFDQRKAQLNYSNQGIEFFFGDINNYHDRGNGYLEFDKTLRKSGGIFNKNDAQGSVDEPKTKVSNAFAYTFNTATLSTIVGVKFEQNFYVGHVSAIMRPSTGKKGDLITYFDKIDGSENGIKAHP